ncbi:MAG: hypothetical protein IPK82_08765 [Polyangiaceae bacterium]|nr:hypothetical protein [Polyangiaceae bacterium]
MRTLRVIAQIGCFVIGMFAKSAFAQDAAAAEALFNKGVAEMEAGHFDVACPALAESQRLDPRPGTMFTLAECEAKAGKIATALVHYEDYLRAAELLPGPQKQRHAQRMDIAKTKKASLAPAVPILTLTLPKNAPPDTKVSRDGTELTAASLGVALPVDPGEHVIVTMLRTGERIEQKISLARGEKRAVEVTIKSSQVGAPTGSTVVETPNSGDGPSGRRVASYVIGGVGIAGLALGGVMGGLALSSKGVVDEHCPNKNCDAEGAKALEEGRTTSLVSTIGLGVGAAGVATAVILLLTEPKKAAASAKSLPGRNVGQSLGVSIDVGPSSAGLRLKGAF